LKRATAQTYRFVSSFSHAKAAKHSGMKQLMATRESYAMTTSQNMAFSNESNVDVLASWHTSKTL
jgi:hypothetical protein